MSEGNGLKRHCQKGKKRMETRINRTPTDHRYCGTADQARSDLSMFFEVPLMSEGNGLKRHCQKGRKIKTLINEILLPQGYLSLAC